MICYEADVHTQIQIAANPPDFIFKSQRPSPNPRFFNLFISVLMKYIFQCLECLLLVEKYIEFSSKNKQLLTNPHSNTFTIEPKSLQSPNCISLFLQFNEKFLMIFTLKYLVK
jgi:hypothetical protein